jgi:hypothetical protein
LVNACMFIFLFYRNGPAKIFLCFTPAAISELTDIGWRIDQQIVNPQICNPLIRNHFPCNHNITAPVINILINASGIIFFQPKFINWS